jgi:hypothetical protein
LHQSFRQIGTSPLATNLKSKRQQYLLAKGGWAWPLLAEIVNLVMLLPYIVTVFASHDKNIDGVEGT